MVYFLTVRVAIYRLDIFSLGVGHHNQPMVASKDFQENDGMVKRLSISR